MGEGRRWQTIYEASEGDAAVDAAGDTRSKSNLSVGVLGIA